MYDESAELNLHIDRICDAFEKAWQQGSRPPIEEYYDGTLANAPEQFEELLLLDLFYRSKAGETPHEDEYRKRFPSLGACIERIFEQSVSRPQSVSCPGCSQAVSVPVDSHDSITCLACGTTVDLKAPNRRTTSKGTNGAIETRFIPRYRLGEGGQGEVWLAEDPELDRFVAIKVIKPSDVGTIHSQSRFLNEARITGQLEHPNIVPVYEAAGGTTLEGAPRSTPYYAMRAFGNRHLLRAIAAYHGRERSPEDMQLLDAISAYHKNRSSEKEERLDQAISSFPFDESYECDRELKEAIAAFRRDRMGRAGCSMWEAIKAYHHSGRKPAELRELLNRFVDVCNAMAYAHSRGVIHRDLKPENVMLGEFGETLVVDWGLAKVVSRAGSAASASPGEDRRFAAVVGEYESKTLAGTVIGTPAYMPPEQAAGSVEDLDAASDVFCLGGILYAILTGRPPYRGTSDRDVLSVALEGRITPPSEILDAMPKPLGFVCLMALSKAPRDRYAGAQQLAADIGRWLADEPISAWNEPVRLKAQRWVRKHQGLASTVTAVVLLAAVLLTAMVAVVSSKNDELADLNLELEERNEDLTNLTREALDANSATQQLLYATEMGQAWQHLIDGDVHSAAQILDRFAVPDSLTGEDLRGFEWWYLNARIRPEGDLLATSAIEQGSLARYSPDGEHLLLGWSDGRVQVLDAETNEIHMSVNGNSGFVYGGDFSPDGTLLATIDDTGVLCLWNLEKREAVWSINAFDGVRGDRVFFNRDGTQLIASGRVGGVRFFDVETGESLGEFSPHNVNPATGVRAQLACGHGLDFIVVADDLGIVRTYDADTYSMLNESPVNPGDGGSILRCIRLSPSGRYVAGACMDNRVCIWDTSSGQKIDEYHGHHDEIQDLAFHPQLPLLFSGDYGGVVRCWRLDFARSYEFDRLTAVDRVSSNLITIPTDLIPGTRYRLAFVSSRLFRGDSANIADYNDFVTESAYSAPELAGLGATWRAIVSTPSIDARANTNSNSAVTNFPVYRLDGARLAENNEDLWDGELNTFLNVTELGTVLDAVTVWTGTGPNGAAEFPLGSGSPLRGATNRFDELWIDIGPTFDSNTESDHVYALSSILTVPEPTSLALVGQTIGWPTVLKAHQDRILSIDVSPEGSRMATGSRDYSFKTWSPRPLDFGRRLSAPNPWSAAFIENGQRLLVAGDTELRVWTAETGQTSTLAPFDDYWTDRASWLTVSSDERVVFTSHPRLIRTWDTQTGELLAETPLEADAVRLDVSDNGKLIVSSEGAVSNLRSWDASQRSFSEPTVLADYKSGWFSPDSQSLVAVHLNDLHAIDPQTAEVKTRFIGHENGVNAVAFSHDGTLMASGSNDRTVRIWDPESGELLQTILAHDSHVNAVAFSVDGRTIASGDANGNITFSHVTTGRVLFTTSVPGQTNINDIDFSPDGRHFSVVRFPHVFVFPTQLPVADED